MHVGGIAARDVRDQHRTRPSGRTFAHHPTPAAFLQRNATNRPAAGLPTPMQVPRTF